MRTENVSDLSAAQFQQISQLIYKTSGIQLLPGKEELVKSRLKKRLDELHLQTFKEYLNLIENDKNHKEISLMVDALTTNKTSFFREAKHFDLLVKHVQQKIGKPPAKIRVWSAGCSSGEEPYTIMMSLRENIVNFNQYDTALLATDLCKKVLAHAQAGVYSENATSDVPKHLLHKYFIRTKHPVGFTYQVRPDARSIIQFAQLNLMEAWPMKGPFDAIFCRNVMIYFDKPTREKLVNRFWQLLKPEGLLFIGHSESLSALDTKFQYFQPAAYIK